jgi:hypothetical protein
MKSLLPIIFCGLSLGGYSQVNAIMPPEADLFYNNAMQNIQPQIKSTIEKNANNLKGRKVNADSLSGLLRAGQSLKYLSQQEIEAITILILVQVSKNADADLKDIVLNVQNNNDNDSQANNTRSIKAATILNNKSQIAEYISLWMKRISGSQNMIIEQLK